MGRVFVLGIDGGSWRVLNSLDLPNFERLIEDGVSGDLVSTHPPITFPAWKCLSTGKNPGKLGVFGFSNFDRERKENVPNDSTSFDGAELWDYASDEGLRVGVVNMPTTYPPHDVNGVMVAGPNSGSSGFVTPEEREEEIKRSYVPLTSGHRLAFKSGGDKAVSAAEETIESRFKTTQNILEKEDFDLFNLTIYCTDTIQHYYLGGAEVRQTYECLDRELGELLDVLEDDWNVVVVSDHGFRPIKGSFYLDTWLRRNGYLNTVSAGSNSVRKRLGLTTNNASTLVDRLGLEELVSRLPESLVRRIAGGLTTRDSVSVVDSVDWDSTEAVFLHGGIHVMGDDRGLVKQIKHSLESLTDRDGERVMDEIRWGDEVYSGDKIEDAPELVPISNNYKLLGISCKGNLFNYDEEWVAGHEMNGVFVAWGNDFETGRDSELSIYDIMPTILHVLGCNVPDDIDGEVRKDILTVGEEVGRRPALDTTRENILTESDRKRMQERLQQLGYK